MKTSSLCIFTSLVFFALCMAPLHAGDAPEILSVRGRSVRVKVPSGVKEVLLQRRTSQRKNPWATLARKNTDTAGGEVTFALRAKIAKNSLRVLGRATGDLPWEFFKGPSEFLGEKVVPDPYPGGSSGSVTVSWGGSGGNWGGLVSNYGDTDTRAVVDGNRAYFINEFRGLQTLDISSPAAPSLLGELTLQGPGQRLFQLDSTHVVVIRPASVFGAAELVVCDVSGSAPVVTGRISTVGDLAHVRVIGTSLYTASSGGVVTGYDLANPSAPVVGGSVSLAVERTTVSVIKSSDRCFMVATWQAPAGLDSRALPAPNIYKVELVDLTQPHAKAVKAGSITLDGPATFLQEQGGVLTAGVNVQTKVTVSGDSSTTGIVFLSAIPSWYGGARTYEVTKTHIAVKNFAVGNLAAPSFLGEIALSEPDERYYSNPTAAFDGSRVYVLSEHSEKPLWIVDNSDTAHPTLAGTIVLPGAGNLIAPLGDRLVTIGRTSVRDGEGVAHSQTTVSLYNVADAANVTSLAEVSVASPTSNRLWDWGASASSVLPLEGLIVIPSSGGGSQLIELTPDTLSLRGILPAGISANRFSLKGDSLLAFGSSDFRAVDLADRDHPALQADTELAWSVNRIWLVGKHLLQLGAKISDARAVLSLTTPDQPDDTLSMLELDPGTVRDSALKGDLLYILQTTPGGYRLTVISIASLPQLVKLSTFTTLSDFAASEISLLFPSDSTAVVCLKSRTEPSLLSYPAEYSVCGAVLLAFDVSNPRALQFLNKTSLKTNGASALSPVLALNSKILMSHQHLKTVFISRYNPKTREVAQEGWRNRHFLSVVDFSSPAAPVQAEPISFPGTLQAADHDGQLLYAIGPEYGEDRYIKGYKSLIYAVALDTAAHAAATTDAAGINSTLRLHQGAIYATRYVSETAPFSLESWALSDDGKFSLRSSVPFAFSMNWRFSGDLIFSYPTSYELNVYDAATLSTLPKVLTLSTTSDPSAYYGSDLAAAEGNLSSGFWLPRGNYGITFLPPQ